MTQRYRSVELRAEVEALIWGRSVDDITRALGYTQPGSIARSLHRIGAHELARPFDQRSNKLRRSARVAV